MAQVNLSLLQKVGSEAYERGVLMARFLAGAKHRRMLAQRDRDRQERAYAEGRMDGKMAGTSAKQAARVLYFDDGESAVCYMNGVDDAVADS